MTDQPPSSETLTDEQQRDLREIRDFLGVGPFAAQGRILRVFLDGIIATLRGTNVDRARDAKYSGTRAEEVGGSVADRRALLQLVDQLAAALRTISHMDGANACGVEARAALALVDGAQQKE